MKTQLLLAGLLLSACRQDDVVAIQAVGRGDLGGPDGGAAFDAGGPDAGSDFCSGAGPIVQVGDQGQTECGGRLAEQTFRYAICTCEDYTASHLLRSDSFDSRRGSYQAGGVGGSVGVNGRFAIAGDTDIGGALWVGGGIQVSGAARLTVRADLHGGGDLRADQAVDVGRDAELVGAVDVGALTVAGTLTTQPGASVALHGAGQVGATASAPVVVPLPCACGVGAILDVPALVARHRATNDNAAVGLDPGAWQNLAGAQSLGLPCGRYYVSSLGGAGTLALTIQGRVVLFVDGDFSLARLTVSVVDGGELDLFVAGNVVASQRFDLGDAAHPGRARLYVGGSGTLELSAGGTFAGNLYAPNSELVSSGPVEVFGSLFVRRLAAADQLLVHYDTAILSSGDACAPPLDPSCNSCLDCRNQACTGGSCGACLNNTDCCAPLFCVSGQCVADPF